MFALIMCNIWVKKSYTLGGNLKNKISGSSAHGGFVSAILFCTSFCSVLPCKTKAYGLVAHLDN